jgi:AraC family transcriptional regulator of adaptative response/methylated-DNA-[protein]-cysteine methyltransferase
MNSVANRNETILPVYSTDEERWAAVMRRDPRADEKFYYSVRTTGCLLPAVVSVASRAARKRRIS